MSTGRMTDGLKKFAAAVKCRRQEEIAMRIYSRTQLRSRLGLYFAAVEDLPLRRRGVVLWPDAPGEFVEEYMRALLGPRFHVATVGGWNGSYHAPEYLPEAVVVTWNTARQPFRRVSAAFRAALVAWKAAQTEALRARLVERGVWRAEGD